MRTLILSLLLLVAVTGLMPIASHAQTNCSALQMLPLGGTDSCSLPTGPNQTLPGESASVGSMHGTVGSAAHGSVAVGETMCSTSAACPAGWANSVGTKVTPKTPSRRHTFAILELFITHPFQIRLNHIRHNALT